MAFEKLHLEGHFAAYQAYSYLVRQQVLQNHAAALNEMLTAIRDFAADVVFIQHPNNGYSLDVHYLQQIKQLPSRPKLVLYEEDPYGHWVKRIDETLKAVLAASDMCFLGGTGYLLELARKAGAKHIRYAPHSYDKQRFGTPWQPTHTRKFDAVMIANLPCLKRIPWLYVPGGRSRKRMADALYKQFGQRFAVYGGDLGWENVPYCHGKIAFNQQGDVIRDAWMSVNWGQYDEIALYSSDRLPISLACGVPHITNYQSGYEHIFSQIPGLFVIKTPKEAVDVATYLLSLPKEQRNELGFLAADYAREHLEACVVYAQIVNVIREQLFKSHEYIGSTAAI
jgi:hypothetical protein